MEEPEQETDPNFEAFFADAPYLLEEEGEGAPPPFALPPPPRPPWLDLEESCAESSPIETCDNIIIIDSQVHLEETFQNLIIIAVCSALLVIMLVFSVACIWRSVLNNLNQLTEIFPSDSICTKKPDSHVNLFLVTGSAVPALADAAAPTRRRRAKVQGDSSWRTTSS